MKHTQKFLEQRKFLMAAPVLVFPFLTALFWALGGGAGSAATARVKDYDGLNFDLPLAHFSEEELDKLSLYEKARRDSMKFQEARDNDPYFKLDEMELVKSQLSKNSTSKDPNELMVTGKLDELYRELNRKPAGLPGLPMTDPGMSKQNDHANGAGREADNELAQLGEMMRMMQSRKVESTDPEEARINSMLDKILDIQHPERVGERRLSSPKAGEGLAVTAVSNGHAETFFGLDEELTASDSANTFEAVVHNTQEIVAGSTVKMRLLNDIYVDGHLIEKDTFIFGTAGINGERLTISVASVRSESSLYPVKLDAYDMDGLEGIYVPGAITRDAAKQSGDQAMQGMQFMTMDQSLGAQAGAAGIQAAKGLFSKKVKLVKVTVKAGYKVLLKDTHR